MLQTEGIIFLSDQRPVFQTSDFRSYQTTPFFEDESIGKQGVEGLLKVCDNTLVAAKTQTIQTDMACAVLLLPLVGGVELTTKEGVNFVEAGEFSYIFLLPGEQLSVENPYETELVNYLELWFSSPKSSIQNSWGKFSLENPKNKLTPLLTIGCIGKYDGRHDNTLVLAKPTNCFVFVINGVFEVQNRLLEPRDSVVLLETQEVEFEALADDSILLIITN